MGETGLLDVRDYQWSVAVPYWDRGRRVFASEAWRGVLCLEMHPHTVCFTNTTTLVRLIEQDRPPTIWARTFEPQPSVSGRASTRFVAIGELFRPEFWQAAAKGHHPGTRPRLPAYGVLDEQVSRVSRTRKHPYPLGEGYRHDASRPKDCARGAFASAGRGHDSAWWGGFHRRASSRQATTNSISIEHEDWDSSPRGRHPLRRLPRCSAAHRRLSGPR